MRDIVRANERAMSEELITNEFATRCPDHPQAHVSGEWIATSGSPGPSAWNRLFGPRTPPVA